MREQFELEGFVTQSAFFNGDRLAAVESE
ncbi:uncharacterized protein METZ01_LOCUS415794, partial [marine metagenome]